MIEFPIRLISIHFWLPVTVSVKLPMCLFGSIVRKGLHTIESRYNVLPWGGRKKVRCIRTENFPLPEIGIWEKYVITVDTLKTGYVVTIVRCIRTETFPLREIGTWEKYVITVDTL